jgi:3-isopropylmalate/(R)-2-methylmalate dehydratase large subunit
MGTTEQLQGARLLPDANMAGIEAAYAGEETTAGPAGSAEIRGKALVFWDPKTPGKKLDAIDTDQITPSADCVSESLGELDARWKAGAFRFLMADFRARVAGGANFVVAGDRFAIGSSREMSPAGLKAIGEENQTELVIVCGRNMGDIFRRNALNLGLHVVQAPDAVADADDGHEMAFDPPTRTVRNLTLGKSYEPLPLTAKEEEIRASGGIFNVGRREFVASVKNPPRIEWADADTARGMTTTEQIAWAHRVDKTVEVRPGATMRLYADLLPGSDGTAPFAIHTFNQITGGDTIYPRRAAVANDHFVFTGKPSDDRQTAISQAFAARYDIRKPYFATAGDGIFHFYFPEQGLIVPGGFYPGADSHSRAYGAYGAVGIGIGSTTLGFGWSTGYIYLTLAKARRVRFVGRLQPWVTGKDVVLALLRKWGSAQAQGMSVELVDVEGQLPMAYRNTIANMMAEAEALNGIFAQDEVTTHWYAQRGIALPYPRLAPGADARYEIDEELDLSEIRPQIARPFHPSNADDAEEVAGERMRFDKAMIGSCTNGSYDDLLQAALVLVQARSRGIECTAEGMEFVIFPGSRGVKEQIEVADPRLGGESIAEIFRAFGGMIRDSWCGPCFGQGPDALQAGQRAITSFNRNWQNRMGFGGEGYLASPAVVAASALAGYMAPPTELGIEWDPGLFEIPTASE